MNRFLTIAFWGVIALFGVPIFGFLIVFILSSFTGVKSVEVRTDNIDLAAATASAVRPDGELAGMFSLISDATDVQREEKERELKGIVVMWTLPVFNVSSRYNGTYVIQTDSSSGTVGTFCTIKPKDNAERAYIVSIKPYQRITCKGVIAGITFRSIDIDPGILIH